MFCSLLNCNCQCISVQATKGRLACKSLAVTVQQKFTFGAPALTWKNPEKFSSLIRAYWTFIHFDIMTVTKIKFYDN